MRRLIPWCVLIQVLEAWRLWVTEQNRKQERLAQAAQFYRDQLLREGVAHVLTYAAHMGSFSTNIALHSQEQVCVSRCCVLLF